ncbi:dihydrolipoyl dehydrogenase [Oceanobacillus oncorhynchi subsp. incaldanensis]|uniref:Dihydrolipoyl dehydrogenase n=2 Tax=Oceanobacillus TaxID=182709 RepID=A0A0A1MYK2_9BACI|nr:dihydrolipoyl dehydrogenase [Oceanobacillus oncorhynchi]MDM8100862.1 dihydrolipoyl dehydrogenase [Oceanobacillus oncorhynchi]UUI38740.1 dihydrolipoyl dehydrogenase [Oceanobacillus oncorhynchi]GIO18232.1 dihydrolipoyl dehydrogenase [Oceanobacillus oncorhynchi subsp. incaldanensis]CEI84442.1 Dihydrolipoyl dehydrogenase [Oceanobacillus oncorhynchi]
MVVGDFPVEVDTLVVGAGPGGYVAAIRAAQLGQKVTIVDKGELGGVCLNVGCIPSKALIEAGHKYQNAKGSDDLGITTENVSLDFSKVQDWKASVVNKLTSGVQGLLKGNKVDIVKGEAYFVDEHTVKVAGEKDSQTYKFNNCILGTGSSPIEIPSFKFSERVLDSTGALALTEVPEKLVVIGSGYVGTELGTAYANFGTEVTFLEGAKDILGGFEKQMTQVVKKTLDKKGAKIVTEAMAKGAEETKDGVKVTYEANGKEEVIEADYVLVTVGRRPNTEELGLEQIGVEKDDRGLIKVDNQGRTSVSNIFAIGDIVPGPALAHKASYEAKIAAEAISGEKAAIDYNAIPAVAFTEPELATVGLSEQAAKDAGYDVKAAKFPFAANGRALSLNTSEGFVKLVTRKEDGLIIGGQIAGPNASDMISEIGLAIEAGMTAEDIALTIHAHPTLGEITMEAAEVGLGTPIHTM